MRHLLLVALLALVGCNTVEDIRAQPVDRTEIVQGLYTTVSACSLDELRAKSLMADYIETVRADLKLSRISARAQNLLGGAGPLVNWEATFADVGDGKTKIELRALHGIFGAPSNSLLWNAIKACSKPV